jgi:hypothetical protein
MIILPYGYIIHLLTHGTCGNVWGFYGFLYVKYRWIFFLPQLQHKLHIMHRSLSVVKLKCDHYDDKHGTLGVSRVQKETRMRKPTARGAKQAARTRTPPGQECGDETETRGHTNNKHSSRSRRNMHNGAKAT